MAACSTVLVATFRGGPTGWGRSFCAALRRDDSTSSARVLPQWIQTMGKGAPCAPCPCRSRISAH